MVLKDRVALITGAGSGNGRATALRFAEEGAWVAVVDIQLSTAVETAELIKQKGGVAEAFQADVSRKADVEACIAAVSDKLGPVDILVNNAGILRHVAFVDLTEDEFDRHLAVNLKGVFLFSQAVVKQMLARKAKGKIINLGSILSLVGSYNTAHYSASKGAVLQLTRGMALELAKSGINVNAIGPGVIETGMTQHNLADPENFQKFLSTIPMRRIGRPQDVAEAALFLASSASDYITGTILFVDGGYTAC